MKVDQYIEDLIAREGGYVDHPADRGGPTNWGITEAVARAFGYHARMQDMPRAVAKQIYLERYWIQPRFDQVNEHSTPKAEALSTTHPMRCSWAAPGTPGLTPVLGARTGATLPRTRTTASVRGFAVTTCNLTKAAKAAATHATDSTGNTMLRSIFLGTEFGQVTSC